ncbi:TonB-dependent receptor [Aurantiacibacter gangjinensis]|uniref:Uncharacterized protein n=1 Tax=Aurantiacibacter gangjinensis TaxID=502682 RepID=A0A0G9ML12_9SPHN|nr:TonB-dependent receptor [Aurantiacibacter gangjinensis]APE27158.1 TonB-dependent receptor [Aurantiacibacter gangjinensis]KLE31299.1 hypothetical protein AAW01_06665 [Aurantiacibacter gangjinensis]
MKDRKLRAICSSVSLAGVAAGILYAPAVSAQDAAASITGEVRRGEDQRIFQGVTIAIPELDVEDTTAADGRYRLPNVPLGEYSIVISYLGDVIDTRTIVVDEAVETFDLSLAEGALNTIVVSGIRGSLNSARAAERENDNLTNVVTADDIGAFADQNVAESLQRLPGVTVRRSEGEGQQVAIRGLSGSFVTVTVDGARIGTRDENSRSVALDIVSSDLLNGIEVSKTLLPNQDADSIAGAINLRTLSAFDRGETTSATLRGEIGYQERSDDFNPRISGDFTRIFDIGESQEFGIAASASWSRRRSIVDDFRGDDGIRSNLDGTEEQIEEIDDPALGDNAGDDDDTIDFAVSDPDQAIFSPNRIDLRSDPAERTRFSSNLNLEYRPQQDTEIYLRGTYSRFEDDDVRNRQRYELNDGDDEEILALGPNSGDITDVDTEKRFRFSDQVDELYVINGGFSHVAGDWTFEGDVNYSLNDSRTPSVEGRFRERDIRVRYENLGPDGVDFEILPNPEDADDDASVPENFDFRFLTQYDFFSEDEIFAARGDIRRDFLFNDRPAFFQFGAKYQERSRDFDVERLRVNSDDDLTLADFPLAPFDDGEIQFTFNPELDVLEDFLKDLAANGEVDQGDPFDAINSIVRDYTANEEVLAGYVMARLPITDRLEIIGGLRIERTDWNTTGFSATQRAFDDDLSDLILEYLQDDLGLTDAEVLASPLGGRFFVDEDGDLDVFEEVVNTPVGISGSNSYTDFLPNLNIRWEPIDDVVIRLSYTEALQRPDFREAAASQFIEIEDLTDEDDFEDALDAGQINGVTDIVDFLETRTSAGTEALPLRDASLNPFRAQQYDASVSWYPNSNTFLQVAAFYKDISDFILPVTLTGDDVALVGVDPTVFDRTVTYYNGDQAEIYGVEFSYTQNYTFLPAPLDGLFFAGNLTLASSSGRDEIFGEIPFPDQADLVGNASLGWEKSGFSLRGTVNYVGERLVGVRTGLLGLEFPQGDELEAARTSFDINARWEITDAIQVYADAININGAGEERFFRGGGLTGPVYNGNEQYGATYQLGARIRF